MVRKGSLGSLWMSGKVQLLHRLRENKASFGSIVKYSILHCDVTVVQEDFDDFQHDLLGTVRTV